MLSQARRLLPQMPTTHRIKQKQDGKKHATLATYDLAVISLSPRTVDNTHTDQANAAMQKASPLKNHSYNSFAICAATRLNDKTCAALQAGMAQCSTFSACSLPKRRIPEHPGRHHRKLRLCKGTKPLSQLASRAHGLEGRARHALSAPGNAAKPERSKQKIEPKSTPTHCGTTQWCA